MSSVHGANRLGSNSLIDLVVFGRAAGIRLREVVKAGASGRPAEDSADFALARLDNSVMPRRQPDGAIRLDMQRTMQADCGVFRTDRTLAEGVTKIDAVLRQDGRRLGRRPQPHLEQRPGRDARARQFARAGGGHDDCAPNRKESRGAHTQEDYPERNDKQWMKHTVAWFDGWGGRPSGGVKIDYRPVHEFTLTDDVAVHQAEEAGLLTAVRRPVGTCCPADDFSFSRFARLA